jgi:serine/threonine protein kinase
VSTREDLGKLNSQDWAQLQEYADRLTSAWDLWEENGEPKLADFLPKEGSPIFFLRVLHELIVTELEIRWRIKKPRRLQEYVHEFPELVSKGDLSAELIYEEFCARHAYGDSPTLESYKDEFPKQFEQVRRLVEKRPPRDPDPTYLSDPQSVSVTLSNPPPAPAPATLGTAPSAPSTTFPQRPSSNVLTVAGEYKLGRVIGRGQFGVVHEALAPGGIKVAIKHISVGGEALNKERHALELLRDLRHTYLLQIQAFWTQGEGELYVVMDLAEGTLADRLAECKAANLPGIPVDELLAFFEEAAEALDYLHAKKVMHRDIKPANLLRLNGHPKVADFGLAKLLELDKRLLDGTLCGTPRYMAPEVWNGTGGNFASDQYSLAATYFEMRTGGAALFDGKTPLEIAEQHIRGRPKLAPLPDAEQRVLRKALAKKPEQRYASCGEFVRALAEAVHPPPRPPVPPRKFPWATAVLIMALMVCLVAIYKLFPRQQPWLPPGFRPGPNTTIVNGYYKEIQYPLPDAPPLEFILIDAKPPDVRVRGEPEKRFYILRTKVSNEQYYAIMKVRLTENEERPDWPNLPAMGMLVSDAHAFAEKVGGLLPSYEQLNKAGGFYDEKKEPYDYDAWRQNKKDLEEKRPWPVGSKEWDKSWVGCKDMAANGFEMTRNLANGMSVPFKGNDPPPDKLFWGSGTQEPEPFNFSKKALHQEGYDEAKFDIGFRVVLDPP